MHKETSSRVSTIAAHYLKQSDRELEILIETNQAEVLKDIRTLSASALGQDEHAGQEKRDFFDRLKDEREDLDRRLAALNSYLTHNPGHPSPAHYEMLKRQAASMSDYLTVLDERIADIESTRAADKPKAEHDL